MDIRVKLMDDPAACCSIARNILEALPDWFAVADARENFICRSGELPMLTAYVDTQPAGFLVLEETSPVACEVHVMGVLPDYHRHGIGRALMQQAIAYCRAKGYQLLHLKTLDASNPDAGYAKTRAFYASVGFLPMQCLPAFWDEDNPCLLMVMPL